MERTALLRSISISSLLFSAPKHSRSFLSKYSSVSSAAAARRHISSNRSLLRRNSWTSLTVAPSHSSSIRFGSNNKHFSSLSPRVVASPDIAGAGDEVAEKYGFEKVSEEFIGECKSKAILFKHKRTSAEVMSVSNDDENKVFGIVFRTPP